MKSADCKLSNEVLLDSIALLSISIKTVNKMVTSYNCQCDVTEGIAESTFLANYTSRRAASIAQLNNSFTLMSQNDRYLTTVTGLLWRALG